MVSKKDILDVVAWASISTIMGITFGEGYINLLVNCSKAAPSTLGFEQDDKKVALVKAAMGMLVGTFEGGIIGGRHIASMRCKYNDRDLGILMIAAVSSTSAICGILSGYAVMPTIYGSQDSINYVTPDQNGSQPGMEFAMEWFCMSMCFGVASVILSIGMVSQGLEMAPLRFSTREEKASSKLEEVLSYDGNMDKDIFDTLERYNKVYRKMFTTLGTPYEMAKITDNKEQAQKISDKNNQLILQGLLANKFVRDNAAIKL